MSKLLTLLEEYEINPFTMMIRPVVKDNHTYSEIYEIEDKFLIAAHPLKVVKRSCEYFGSSFEGRREGTRKLMNITHKSPIIVDPHTSIFLFPTTSPKNPECIWINHEHVVSHYRGRNNNTMVKFINNEIHEIPVSYHTFSSQLTRTAQLRTRFNQNIERMVMYRPDSTKSFYMKASEKRRMYRTED